MRKTLTPETLHAHPDNGLRNRRGPRDAPHQSVTKKIWLTKPAQDDVEAVKAIYSRITGGHSISLSLAIRRSMQVLRARLEALEVSGANTSDEIAAVLLAR